MPGKVKTYDSKKILIALGSHNVSYVSDGSFITIEENGDGFTSKTGCDGEKIRSTSPDNSATITINLQQKSPTVGFAQRQYDLDRETGEGTFPVLVKDLKGGLLFSAEEAWVVKAPSREYGREATDRELVIETGAATWEGED